MKIEINDKIINACKLNRPVLDLLCPKRSGRYTKLEAYIDLLDRIASQKNDDVHTGEVVSVVPGEFAVTITELSEKWNWHRATVRSFLDSLEEIGEIKKIIQKHCYKVSMVNHVRMFIPIDTPEDMLDYCRILYAHLSMRLRSMNELVPFAEQYCRLSAESEGENRRYWCDEAYIIGNFMLLLFFLDDCRFFFCYRNFNVIFICLRFVLEAIHVLPDFHSIPTEQNDC